MAPRDGDAHSLEEAYEYEVARAKRLDLEVGRLQSEIESTRAAVSSGQRVADSESSRAERELDRLKSRRAVRIALGIARLARPLFRARRRGLGGLRSPRTGNEPAPAVPQVVPEADTKAAARPERDELPRLDLLTTRRSVTIIVPVYGAFEELRRCLESVIRNSTVPAALLLIDDASPDDRIAPYLEQLASSHPHVSLLNNPENLGFVKTVNRGFEASAANDVVILNSDTEVPPRWLEQLQQAAYSDPLIGTVTPFSNNAGAFSAPVMGAPTEVPVGRDEVGRLVARHSGRLVPSTPTGNGFCLFIKREVLDTIGFFDAELFPRGYGEENDFSMRASAAGWRHVIDDSTFVLHSRSASFKEERAELLAQGRAKVDERHPRYGQLVTAFLNDRTVEEARNNVGRALDEGTTGAAVRPRILFVLHSEGGGTPRTNADLMAAVQDRYEPLLLRSGRDGLTLTDAETGERLERASLPEPVSSIRFESGDYQVAVSNLLQKYSIELVHIRHLQSHTFDLPAVAEILDIPVVMSFHDYYYCCPTTTLLDQDLVFCGGTCTPGQGDCLTPRWFQGSPHLKHGWVRVWQDRAREMFGHVSAFVTTSESAAAVYRDVFPELSEADFRVVEHGRDLEQRASAASYPAPNEPFRIALPGHIGVHKGARFLEELQEVDADGRLEFHLLGTITDEVSVDVVDHGTYDREEFAVRMAEIRPAAVGLFSLWAETYSHTLTEAWSVGVPVIATHFGALAERIAARGGGWTIDPSDPQAAYEKIIGILSDRSRWEERRREAVVAGLPTTRDMADRYAALYEEVWNRRRTFAPGGSS